MGILANFPIFLTLTVPTFSWNPFFRIPCKFLHRYRSLSPNFLHENGLYYANISRNLGKSVIFCRFFQFFSNLLFPQHHGTHFFGFLAIFYVDVDLWHRIFFMKMAFTMRILAEIMENLLFFAVFQFFSNLLFPQLHGTHFFGFFAIFYVDIGLFH